MNNRYIDLIEQTFDFPQDEFTLQEDFLRFHDIDLAGLIETYGTPLKFTYLPQISNNIIKAKRMFQQSFDKLNYTGKYHYCYCTKSSHFKHVLNEALKNDIHLETSSAIDMDIIQNLKASGAINNQTYIISNGFKTKPYIANIAKLINEGHQNCIPVIDNYAELDLLSEKINGDFNIGIRIASEEEPKFEFYTSRLGIGYKDIVPFYDDQIKGNKRLKLKMLHFFINTGIRDNAYYWNELVKCLKVYVNLKKKCPKLGWS